MTKHLHELFYRFRPAPGEVILKRFLVNSLSTDDVDPGLEEIAVGMMKQHGDKPDRRNDGIVYRIDGKCEFFISAAYFNNRG